MGLPFTLKRKYEKPNTTKKKLDGNRIKRKRCDYSEKNLKLLDMYKEHNIMRSSNEQKNI